jgi:putative ABC transport system substrate-binding protein
MLGLVAVAPRALAQDRVRLVGYLSGGSGPEPLAKALAARGQLPDRTFRIETRVWSRIADADLEAKALDLVRLQPDVLVAFTFVRTQALFAATKTIPIVTGATADPVGVGFARSLARPGLNVTGLASGYFEAAQRTVEVSRTILPRLARVRIPRPQPGYSPKLLMEAVARAGVVGELCDLRDLAGLQQALREIKDPATEAILLPLLRDNFDVARAAEMAVRRRVALLSLGDALVEAGGLLACAFHHSDSLGRVAGLVDKILRGARPADMPFEMPDRDTLAINRATAAAIGLNLPPEILIRATRVFG